MVLDFWKNFSILDFKAVDNYIAKLLPARIEMRKQSKTH